MFRNEAKVANLWCFAIKRKRHLPSRNEECNRQWLKR
jgi:hypothetical protein